MLSSYTIQPKTVGAAYHQFMTMIFKEMLGDMVESYVDDLVVKSHQRTNHVELHGIVFNKLCQHHLKMNQLKCAFRSLQAKSGVS